MNKIIGISLLSLPFVGIAVAIITICGWSEGLKGLLIVFGGTALIVACVVSGVYLIDK